MSNKINKLILIVGLLLSINCYAFRNDNCQTFSVDNVCVIECITMYGEAVAKLHEGKCNE